MQINKNGENLKNEQMINELKKLVSINFNNQSIACECSICHTCNNKKLKPIEATSFDSFYKKVNKGELYDKDIDEFVNKLYDDGWRVEQGLIYCSNCYAQLQTLIDISKNVSERPSKIQYYLNIAKEVSTRSTCLRKRYGSIIVKNDSIISTGYNGSPRGTNNCIDMKYCRREKLNIPRGQNYEMCRAVHSEMNAIINASHDEMIGSTLYMYGYDVINNCLVENLDCCQMCKKIIINAGIENVIFARPNNNFEQVKVKDWVINDETLTDKMGY